MIATIHALAAELRRVRIPVATSDVITAVEALLHIDLGDPAEVKASLAASIIKQADHRPTFDLLFTLFFAGRTDGADRPLGALTDGELRAALVEALTHPNRHLLQEIATEAIARHARIKPGRRSAGTYYIYRTMEALRLDSLREEILPPASYDTPALAWITERTQKRKSAEAFEEFERIVESQVRNRLAAEMGAADLAGMLRHLLPEDTEFLTASADAVKLMDAAIAPMASALGNFLQEKRRSSAQTVDLGRTLRRSLSHGGIPVNLEFKSPKAPKPRLVILADISGSVASFAAFGLQLAFALRAHFSRHRSFVFVDGTDEVTDLIHDVRSITKATERINREHRGVWIDGHSDYGNAFTSFVEHHINSIDAQTTVLILGDGRNNYRDPCADALADIHARSAGIFWLNPEHPRLWRDGDAAMGHYAPHCDEVVECRTIRQLDAFIRSLAQRGTTRKEAS